MNSILTRKIEAEHVFLILQGLCEYMQNCLCMIIFSSNFCGMSYFGKPFKMSNKNGTYPVILLMISTRDCSDFPRQFAVKQEDIIKLIDYLRLLLCQKAKMELISRPTKRVAIMM